MPRSRFYKASLAVAPNSMDFPHSNAMTDNQQYDLSTAVTITEDLDAVKNEVVEENVQNAATPRVLCATHNKWFVLSIGADVHVFDLTVGMEQMNKYHFVPEEDCDFEVIAVQFLPDCDVFVLVLSNGAVHMVTPFYGKNAMKPQLTAGKSKTTDKQKELKGLTVQPIRQQVLPSISHCSMAIVDNQDKAYLMCVLDSGTGIAHMVELPKPDTVASKAKSQIKSITEISLLYSSPNTGCRFVVSTGFSFVFFPTHQNGTVKVANHSESLDDFELSDMFTLAEDLCMVKIVGAFVVALTASTNQLLFFDSFTLIQVHQMSLSFVREHITDNSDVQADALDFEFLDVANYSEFAEDVKMLFKVRTAEGVQFVIRSLNDRNILFNVGCADQIAMVPHSAPGDDANIIFVETFPQMQPNGVLIRFVSEAQPEQRLKRLIDSDRFEEALAFAKKHEISLDEVYNALIRKYQNEIESPEGYKDEAFQKMMEFIAMLSDHDDACDTCVGILMSVPLKYEHIIAILTFTERKKIYDATTSDQIARFRYDFASYRMLLQVRSTTNDFGQTSHWQAFLTADDDHASYFEELCKGGRIDEAKILLTRYPELAQHLNSLKTITELFSNFESVIAAKPQSVKAISKFIESHLMEFFLTYSKEDKGPNSNCDINVPEYRCQEIGTRLIEFLLEISTMLERVQPTEFPENSLNFAQTFKRGFEILQKNCQTPMEQTSMLYILKMMDVDSMDESKPIGQLNTRIQKLKALQKIIRTYECPMKYEEYLTHTVDTICHQILGRVKTAQSVNDHMKNFVFKYMDEHKLDRNKMLLEYMRQFAGTFCQSGVNGSSQYNNTWVALYLQITENISDLDLRCQAIIEIASGAVPPWTPQLTATVKDLLKSKIDPRLKEKLELESMKAALGQHFIVYDIPLHIRSRITNVTALKSLLQFIFKSSKRDPTVKLDNAFGIVKIYERLISGYPSKLISRVDCYYLYAVVEIQKMTDDEQLRPLVEFFQLIKQEEDKVAVAWNLVHYLKALLKPTKITKAKEQRLIWLACLLCVAERYLPRNSDTMAMIQKVRNIRNLHVQHDVMADFSTFGDTALCHSLLHNYIIDKPKDKFLVQVHNFGCLLGLPLRSICELVMNLQMQNGEPALLTLEFLTQKERNPTVSDLDVCLRVYTHTLHCITKAVSEDHHLWGLDPMTELVQRFKASLPTAVDWATKLDSGRYVAKFCQISRYISLLDSILKRCVSDTKVNTTAPAQCSLMPGSAAAMEVDEICSEDSGPNRYDANSGTSDSRSGKSRRSKLYTYRLRMGAFLPADEGVFFESTNVIKFASEVASSVVDPPLEEQDVERLYQEMRENWMSLISNVYGHLLLQLQIRQFACTLPCFTLSPMDLQNLQYDRKKCIQELSKKILSVPMADIGLAAHVLYDLSENDKKEVLNWLVYWSKKESVRVFLNVLRVAISTMWPLLCKEYTLSTAYQLHKQCQECLESCLWRKRLQKFRVKCNKTRITRDVINEHMGEFVKALLPPSVLLQLCMDRDVKSEDQKRCMLTYAMDLCRASCSLDGKLADRDRFRQTIETARAAFRIVEPDTYSLNELISFVDQLCPYNYEAIELVLKQLKEWAYVLREHGTSLLDEHQLVWLKDRLSLIQFLKVAKRTNAYTDQERRWYRSRLNNAGKSMDMSSLMRNVSMGGQDDTTAFSDSALALNPGGTYRKPDHPTESPMPAFSAERLPFHVFLYDKDALSSIVLPIMNNEINIYNVSRWLSLIADTSKSILDASRAHILVDTIQKCISEAIQYKRELSNDDHEQIKALLKECASSPDRGVERFLVVFMALATGKHTNNMKLCWTKISTLRIILEVGIECQPLFEHKKEQQKYLELCDNKLPSALEQYQTDLLLWENGLLDQDAAALSKSPSSLIVHLCSNTIDWKADVQIIDSQFELIEKIAEINKISLDNVYKDLITSWMPESEQLTEAGIGGFIDPDATLDFSAGFNAGGGGDSADEAEEILQYLYDDPSSTKIIYLLKKCDQNKTDEKDDTVGIVKDTVEHMANILNQYVGIIPGGYKTKIRTACCLLRFLSEDRIKKFIRMTLEEFCLWVSSLLNERLLSVSRPDMGITEFNAMLFPKEKTDQLSAFLNSLLAPQSQYRQTPEVAHLLTTAICDTQLTDVAVLAKAAERLQQLRMMRPLLGLLRYARKMVPQNELRHFPNLNMYYGRCFEAIFEKCDMQSDDYRNVNEIQATIFFVLGCPIEGRSYFSRAVNSLAKQKAPRASVLVSIADAATTPVLESELKQVENRRAVFDL
ncbi:kinetochore-associated protein rod-1 [Ditylenchus destructor]|nr:kinetochore-associated protein rod-1 [Ditylenchus destructor]